MDEVAEWTQRRKHRPSPVAVDSRDQQAIRRLKLSSEGSTPMSNWFDRYITRRVRLLSFSACDVSAHAHMIERE